MRIAGSSRHPGVTRSIKPFLEQVGQTYGSRQPPAAEAFRLIPTRSDSYPVRHSLVHYKLTKSAARPRLWSSQDFVDTL